MPVKNEEQKPTQMLSVAQAERECPFSQAVIRRAIRSGRLIARQPSGPGGRLLILREDLDRWLLTQAEVHPGLVPEQSTVASQARVDGLIADRFTDEAISRFAREHRAPLGLGGGI